MCNPKAYDRVDRCRGIGLVRESVPKRSLQRMAGHNSRQPGHWKHHPVVRYICLPQISLRDPAVNSPMHRRAHGSCTLSTTHLSRWLLARGRNIAHTRQSVAMGRVVEADEEPSCRSEEPEFRPQRFKGCLERAWALHHHFVTTSDALLWIALVKPGTFGSAQYHTQE